MKLVKRKNTKRCACCDRIFHKSDFNCSVKQWIGRKYCSVKCKNEGPSKEKLSYILSKTIKNDSGCLEWTGCIDYGGYGVTSYLNKCIRPHRLIWLLLKGEIPKEMCVCHKCDNRICLNIDHLFLGTKGDNSDDKRNKGRHLYKLNLIKMEEVIDLIKKGVPYIKIGNKFNVTRGYVSRIGCANGIHRRVIQS